MIRPADRLLTPAVFEKYLNTFQICLRYTVFVLQLPAYLPVYHAPEWCGRASAESSITLLLVNLRCGRCWRYESRKTAPIWYEQVSRGASCLYLHADA